MCLNHLERFLGWWKRIADSNSSKGQTQLTVTPEFGPPPYMPLEPFTQKVLSHVWENNLFMLQTPKEKFSE
jgi:hypothetical protein